MHTHTYEKKNKTKKQKKNFRWIYRLEKKKIEKQKHLRPMLEGKLAICMP